MSSTLESQEELSIRGLNEKSNLLGEMKDLLALSGLSVALILYDEASGTILVGESRDVMLQKLQSLQPYLDTIGAQVQPRDFQQYETFKSAGDRYGVEIVQIPWHKAIAVRRLLHTMPELKNFQYETEHDGKGKVKMLVCVSEYETAGKKHRLAYS